jgi:hypothetical protein
MCNNFEHFLSVPSPLFQEHNSEGSSRMNIFISKFHGKDQLEDVVSGERMILQSI